MILGYMFITFIYGYLWRNSYPPATNYTGSSAWMPYLISILITFLNIKTSRKRFLKSCQRNAWIYKCLFKIYDMWGPTGDLCFKYCYFMENNIFLVITFHMLSAGTLYLATRLAWTKRLIIASPWVPWEHFCQLSCHNNISEIAVWCHHASQLLCKALSKGALQETCKFSIQNLF